MENDSRNWNIDHWKNEPTFTKEDLENAFFEAVDTFHSKKTTSELFNEFYQELLKEKQK